MAIPESIKKLANDIRTKIYGRDVRESLASGIEAAGSIANDADVRSQETETKQTNLEKKYDEQIANMSLENPSVAEVVDARVSGYDGQNFDTIGKRMDKVDAQLAQKALQGDLDITNANVAKKADISKFNVVKTLNSYSRYDYKAFMEFIYPTGFLGTFRPVKIFTDGKFYYTKFNPDKFKNTGGTTYYVSPDGLWDNPGTKEQPLSIYTAISSKAVDGDTIILKKGYYFPDSFGALPVVIKKSINIIAEEGVYFVFGKRPSFTYNSSTGLYESSLANVYRIIDFDSPDFSFELKQVSSIMSCQSTANSFYTDLTKVYVNANVEDFDLVGLQSHQTFHIVPDSEIKVYLENFTIIGGQSNIIVSKNPDYPLQVTLYKVTGLYNVFVQNAFRFMGGNILAVDCKAMYAKKDGFGYINYNLNSEYVETNFMEINTIGANNGLTDTETNNNGSTAHTGTKGIRVNSRYYNNKGANVGDVQQGTQTVNMGVWAYESASKTQQGEGFSLQQAGADVWLYNCVGFGNPNGDVVAYSGTTAYISGGAFENIGGSGTIKYLSD